MTSNREEPKSAQSFIKSSPVMHVSVRHMLKISKQSKNAKAITEKSLALGNFYKAFEQHSITPYNLHPKFYASIKGLIKLHKPGKFH